MLEQLDISIYLFALLVIEFALHLIECFLLSLLSDLPVAFLPADAVFQHVNLVLVVVFDCLDHGLLLPMLLDFTLFVELLLVEELVLF